jgi:hypothetical protein
MSKPKGRRVVKRVAKKVVRRVVDKLTGKPPSYFICDCTLENKRHTYICINTVPEYRLGALCSRCERLGCSNGYSKGKPIHKLRLSTYRAEDEEEA